MPALTDPGYDLFALARSKDEGLMDAPASRPTDRRPSGSSMRSCARRGTTPRAPADAKVATLDRLGADRARGGQV
jgi:hypothetical protein